MPFYLGRIYKKGQCTNFFFEVFTCLSNMFTHYIKNLEIYNAFIISEPEFTVCGALQNGFEIGVFEVGVTVASWRQHLPKKS